MRTWIGLMTMPLLACGPAAPPPTIEEAPDVEEPREDEEPPASALNVEVVDDPDAVWACDALGGPTTCAGDYLDLAAVLAPPELDLDACVDGAEQYYVDIVDGRIPLEEEEDWFPSADELADRVTEVLGLREWIDGIDDRPLVLTRRMQRTHETYVEEEFLVSDPLVGTFELRFFRPFSDGPVPALIGMPGHPLSDDQTEDFLHEHHGYTYLEHGYAVAVLGFRAYDSGRAEHDAGVSLLCAGSSLTAVKNYEVLLVHKYLRLLEEQGGVDGVGLIGHSGGSVAGNALIRQVFDRVDAYVTDLSSSYMNVQPCDSRNPRVECVIDETMPALYRIHARINDFNNPTLTVPYVEQEYGYPDGPGEVLDFLDDVLRGGSEEE